MHTPRKKMNQTKRQDCLFKDMLAYSTDGHLMLSKLGHTSQNGSPDGDIN